MSRMFMRVFTPARGPATPSRWTRPAAWPGASRGSYRMGVQPANDRCRCRIQPISLGHP